MRSTRQSKVLLLTAALMTTSMSTAASAQTTAPAVVSDVNAGKIDPVAIQALRTMGAYLKTLQSFEITSKATIVNTMEDTDLQITLGLENTYRVQRPDKFFVSMRSDRQVRDYYYDGKTFTVNIPRQKFFATVSAPPTITDVVDDIYDEYGITLPLSDLLTWSQADAPTDGIATAIRIGFAKINNVDTDQFAYRGKELDFQIWISRGPKPLPMKIAITNPSDPDRPSYSAELNWKTDVRFPATTFAFKAEAGASPIQMARFSGGK